ncbi:type IA DNA topoisomerase [Lichenibacterium ramalinae]|uniref:type IA DNA topoisomerase n=1 Tax=Lichenibacterium ramalinae TaxID=2316527 RepID=UPI001A922AF2|nr:DNA topoisomerase [Lichenibacterium ramalinae]
MSTPAAGRTLFLFEKPSAMRQLQRFFTSPDTVCVAAEGHLLGAEEPGDIRPDWKPWRFEALPIVLDAIPVRAGRNRSGQSHRPKLDAIRAALRGVARVIIATDPGREGSMIAWEILEHLGWRGRIDRLKLGALDDRSIRRAFAAMAREPDSGERDYAAYLEALCRQYEDYHLGLNGTRAISLRLRPPAFREPWRFGGVQTPTLAILADLEGRIRAFVPRDFFKVALPVVTRGGAELTLWHAPKERIFDPDVAETVRAAAAGWSGRLAVEQKDVRRPPPRLFSKDTLARRCAKRFGWDPQHTAKLAQDLYDRGYLTYPRTESEYLPESQAADAAAVVAAVVTVLADCVALVPAADALVVRRGARGHYVKDPGEHHAIVPLRKVPAGAGLAPDLFRLWDLVARAFLAAHMPDGIDARTSVSAEVATPLGPRRFTVGGSVVREPGWRAVYGTEAEADAEVVPGRAKRDDDVTVARLPAVRHGEEARARGAEVATAVTEPPRRITRGELPVVMGRLIDQVEDPEVKRALENPVNPNEPKGLGTAATRDTMLPKLLKSHYIALQPGKDPAIAVTEVGLAFLAAVRRVFPAYGDPVGRAVFEAELGEIGRAATRDEALRRAEAFRQRTRRRVEDLIAAISGATVLDVAPAPRPAAGPGGTGRGGTGRGGKGRGKGGSRGGEDAGEGRVEDGGEGRVDDGGEGRRRRAPTAAMLAYATALAERKGLKLPRGLKADGALCRAFLSEHAGPRGPASAKSAEGGGPRAPSAAMLRYADSLVRQLGVACPPEVAEDFAACRRFLDAHAVRAPTASTAQALPQGAEGPAGGPAAKPKRRAAPARRPGAAAARGRGAGSSAPPA